MQFLNGDNGLYIYIFHRYNPYKRGGWRLIIPNLQRVESIGQAYKARAAEEFCVQFQEILYYIYLCIFPRLTKMYYIQSQYKIIIIHHNKL